MASPLLTRDQVAGRTWLQVIASCWLVVLIIAACSLAAGYPNRFIRGRDSFGNTCGQKNQPVQGVPWSGMDMTGRPYVFHLNPRDRSQSMKICVPSCPARNLTDAVKYFHETRVPLVRYDYAAALHDLARSQPDQDDTSRGFGPLPATPMAKHLPMLSSCVTIPIPADVPPPMRHSMEQLYDQIDFAQLPEAIASSGPTALLSMLIGTAGAIIALYYSHLLDSKRALFLLILSPPILHSILFKLYPGPPQYAELIRVMLPVVVIYLAMEAVVRSCIVFSLRSQLEFVLNLLKQAGACSRSMPSLAIMLLAATIASLMYCALGLLVYLSVWSLDIDVKRDARATRFHLHSPAKRVKHLIDGQPTFAPTADLYHLESVDQETPLLTSLLSWFAAILVLWTAELMTISFKMIITRAVVQWHYKRHDGESQNRLIASTCQVVERDLSSVALGSGLITVIKTPLVLICVSRFTLDLIGTAAAILIVQLDLVAYSACTIMAADREVCILQAARRAIKHLASNKLKLLALVIICSFAMAVCLEHVLFLALYSESLLVSPDNYMIVHMAVTMIAALFGTLMILALYQLVLISLFICSLLDNSRHTSQEPAALPFSGLDKKTTDVSCYHNKNREQSEIHIIEIQ